MTLAQTLALLVLFSATEDQAIATEADAPEDLGSVETGSSYAGELRAASFTYVSRQGDLIKVHFEVDAHEHVARELTVGHRKATVSIAPRLLKCIPNPDPQSIVLVLGYVDPKLHNRESIAYVTIAFDWYRDRQDEAGVDRSAVANFAAHILDGEVVWAEVGLPAGKRIELKPDGSDCDFVRDL